jgi:hypothetical protein
MTEGIPARTSMELLRNAGKAPSLKYSPRKIDMEIEKGMQINIAMNDVMRVPRRKGSAPNFSAAESHVVPQKKVMPKVLMAGIEATRRVARIASRRTTMNSAETRRTLLNLRSDLSTVLFMETPFVCTLSLACCKITLFIV